MKQKVNPKMRLTSLAQIAMGAVAAGTGINLALLWLNIPFRLYLSSASWYYVNLLSGNDWLGGVLGAVSCLVCGLLTRDLRLGRKLYTADTVLLLGVCLFFLENPLCCLPELAAHGAVLALLWAAPASFRQS